MKFLEKYYPIFLAFLSFLYSVFLWFTGNEMEGIYVGLWPVTILAFAIALRQRRNDKKQKPMKNKLMFVVGFIFFAIYVFFYFKIVLRQKFKIKKKRKHKS